MISARQPVSFMVLAIVACSVVLSSCGGGGAGGGGSGLVLITADGASGPLWSPGKGASAEATSCPAGVFVNGRIYFTFGGPVDPASVPAGPVASGSINVVAEVTGTPAQGTFTVEDDPALSAGNQRRVVFTPALPTDPASSCSGGFESYRGYTVSLASGATSAAAIVVDGERLGAGAVTCFRTCGCPSGGGCSSPFLDAVAGAPFVTGTNPPTADPALAGIAPSSIVDNTIQINISEPLDPAGIDLNHVRLVNTRTGAQVPGSLVFHQATSVSGTSRIDYVASAALPGGATYQIVLDPAIKDFGGNPIEMAQGNAAAVLLLVTSTSLSQPPPPLVENFNTANPPGSTVTGAASWSGNGFLQAVFPLNLTGNGSDGAFSAPATITTILDTNQLVGGVSRAGVWNFTSINIPATAIVRIIGPYQAHLRSLGAVTVDGTINVNAAAGPSTSVNIFDRGPEPGIQNNNAGLNCEANGGIGNAGGGAGGTGSGVTPPAGSPPTFQCTVRVATGENGYGPTLAGALNTGVPANPSYAGGQGGDSGCFPAAGTGCTTGDLGGLGGAGGSAGRIGEAGLPRTSTALCAPTVGVVQPIAQPTAVPVVMTPPIAVFSAGSGGGGGGDHWDPVGTPPSNDDQGGGGGGGGGGLRISCVGAYSQGLAGVIFARGAQGNVAQSAAGCGGSGSGGEVWIQSFSTVTINAAATIDVTGPVRFQPSVGLIGCSNQAAGGGGAGLVQLEAGAGPTPTASFNLQPVPTPTSGAVFSAPPFAFGATITGQGRSGLRYSGTFAPDYTSAVEVFSLGTAAGATLTIRYEGAHETVNSTPQNPIPDPTTLKTMATGGGPITAANLNELDGYAFIEFIVDFSFPAPPATPPTATLPSVNSITINLLWT